MGNKWTAKAPAAAEEAVGLCGGARGQRAYVRGDRAARARREEMSFRPISMIKAKQIKVGTEIQVTWTEQVKVNSTMQLI